MVKVKDVMTKALTVGPNTTRKELLLAAKKLKVNPKECVVIEDALNGIVAAKKAGMMAIAITTTFQKKVFEKKADKIINSLKELSKKMIEGA
jgi:beta-phosphoglucomutase-like phosphatase (HAD superfamily)